MGSALLTVVLFLPTTPRPAAFLVELPAFQTPVPVDPLAAELAPFPGPELVRINRAFARTHVEWLEAHATVHGWYADDCGAWLLDACRCHRAWDLLDDAQEQWRTPACRRESLECLRRRLGEVDYRAGRMPAVVPLWRFRRMD